MSKTSNETVKAIRGEDLSKVFKEKANALLYKNVIFDDKLFAIEYASKEELLKVVLNETEIVAIIRILKRLEKDGITEEEANILLNAKHNKTVCFAIKYASKMNVLERALTEENYNFVVCILERLNNEKITKTEANILLKSKSRDIVNFAIKYASKKKVFERALLGDCETIDNIFKRLEKEEITEAEANILLSSNSFEIRCIAVQYASKDEILKIAMEENANVIVHILKRLEKDGITKTEANKLLDADSFLTRSFAVEHAAKEELLKMSSEEYSCNVIFKIFDRFISEGMSKKELDILLDSKIPLISTLAEDIYYKFFA